MEQKTLAVVRACAASVKLASDQLLAAKRLMAELALPTAADPDGFPEFTPVADEIGLSAEDVLAHIGRIEGVIPALDPYDPAEWKHDIEDPMGPAWNGDWAAVREMSRADALIASGFAITQLDQIATAIGINLTEIPEGDPWADGHAIMITESSTLHKGVKAIHLKNGFFTLIQYNGKRISHKRNP